eukprot:scpid96303/ scgid15105/ 
MIMMLVWHNYHVLGSLAMAPAATLPPRFQEWTGMVQQAAGGMSFSTPKQLYLTTPTVIDKECCVWLQPVDIYTAHAHENALATPTQPPFITHPTPPVSLVHNYLLQ